MRKLYYIQVKNSVKDICFWDADIKIDKKPLGCLAFFYLKSNAKKYQRFLESEDKLGIEYEVKYIEL